MHEMTYAAIAIFIIGMMALAGMYAADRRQRRKAAEREKAKRLTVTDASRRVC